MVQKISQIGSKFAYHCIVFPISLLPLPVIYVFTDLFYLLLISIIPYRREVVEKNLRNSFPDKSRDELKKIRNQFYRHFTDLLAEGVKNLSMSEKELHRRVKVQNPALMQNLFHKKQSVLLVSGHYNNWEWLILGQNILFSHQAVGIGMPMSNAFWDQKINERRSRFGMKILNAKTVKSEFEVLKNTFFATLILSDQSPGDSTKAYWLDFLNQPTPVLFGCELMAHQYNHAVVFFVMHKVKRGHYSMELKLITDNPSELNWGKITETHTYLLEEEILKNPQYWLWSHKRWKREVPEDLATLRREQKENFDERFKDY
jgi:KDO2-lipid IV(A) lauroyltransferase